MEVVIAKYNENISWSHYLPVPVTVYDKSKDIPNIGREGETFLRHIVERYDSLSEKTLFLQGDPFDHSRAITTDIGEIIFRYRQADIKTITPFECPYHKEHVDEISILEIRKNFKTLLNRDPPEFIHFAAGCQYVIHSDYIKRRPKEYYQGFRDFLTNDHNCYVFERIFPYIFENC
jgi:hypothetical protein